MPLMVSFIAAIAIGGQSLSFQDLEDRKIEALNSTTGFRGTYVMVSIPSEGDATRQEVTLTISPEGRKTRLNVNGRDVAESAYTKTTKWTAILLDKVYQLNKPEGGFPVPPPVPPLRPAPGEMALTVDDLGVRFATNPAAILAAPRTEVVDGRSLTRYDAKTVNPETQTQVQIIQWFDANSFILRQFEIIKTTDDKVSRVKGYLVRDKIGTKIDSTEFDLPPEVSSGFRRIDG